MYDNATRGCDLGWFTEGKTHEDFENEIINGDHNVDDIFTIDIASQNWYYAILKTYEPKNISEITILKIL
ncbi:hypothetical protein A8C32_00650 [Flavivirga aquatica]|uniref:Uncharacterized protein n=2 Tax=Flavivirga aquatica TaxID=1849968 RepID=A0A1E5TBT2_9FLAO|nr:hypothetical protein A8C32_00650 [Flavivirga aquatica]